MSNQDIKRTAAGTGIKLWRIADALGIVDCSFSHKFCKGFSQEKKEKTFSIMRESSQGVS